METRSLVTAVLFIAIGLIAAVRPLLADNLRAWFGRQVLDRKTEPEKGMLLAYRVVGIIFFLVGIGMLFTQLR